MKVIIKILLVVAILTAISCNPQKKNKFRVKETYKSNDLIITQITENSFVHTSYKQTEDFGNVPCNGLIVRSNNQVIVFDTPANNESSEQLIKWINEKLNCTINAIIPTHFHDDSLGGLEVFHNNNISSYAYQKTIELAKESNFVVPINTFSDSLNLKIGEQKVIVRFFGEGHTKDNVVGYFPNENVMFGGCLIKELNATKGYLGDANVAKWSNTVEKVKNNYPDVKVIVPGHGQYGDRKLLDYTINLFKIQ